MKPQGSAHARPLLYMYKFPRERSCYLFHGVRFAEFQMAAKLNRPLIVFDDGNTLERLEYDRVSRLNYVDAGNLSALAAQDIYGATGDFVWIDTPKITNLNRLSSQETAGLLYLAHTFRPLGSPFFRSLKNQFAYLAHDDGWSLKLYARHAADVGTIMESLIAQKARQFLQTTIATKGLGSRLLSLSKEGVLLDFRPVVSGASAVRISQPGKFVNMDLLQQTIAKNSSPPILCTLTSAGLTRP